MKNYIFKAYKIAYNFETNLSEMNSGTKIASHYLGANIIISPLHNIFFIKKWLFLIFPLIFNINLLYCQEEQVTISSPNAASYSRYGEIPVNLFTGQPNIEIPLWDISIGEINIPIKLSYHPSGNRVQDRASSVGLGWSLNYGGGISCQVKHLPDFEPSGFGNSYGGGKVLEVINDYLPLYRFPIVLNNYLWGLDLSGMQREILFDASHGRVDLASDIYNYSLPGLDGKFFFNNYGKVINMNKLNNATCTVNYLNGRHNSYKIYDQYGKSFILKSNERTYSDGGIAYPYSSNQITYWLLDTVRDINNNEVIYKYKDYNVNCWELFSTEKKPTNLSISENWVYTNYFNKVIDSIITKNQKVVFYKSNNRIDIKDEYTYDSIVVFSHNTPIRKIKFFYSYFVGIPLNVWFNDNTSHLRLRLDSLLVDNNIYKFTYNQTQLPSRYSKSMDAWGYYNGANNEYLIPSYFSLTNSYIYYGADRRPNLQYLSAGILNEIQYPTGGMTKFEYESNDVFAPRFDEIPYLIAFNKMEDLTSSFDININHCVEIPFTVAIGENSFNFFTTMYPDTIDWRQRVQLEIRELDNTKIADLKPRDSVILNLVPGNYKIVLNGLVNYSSYIQIHRKWNAPEFPITATYNPYINKIIGGLRIKKVSNYTKENLLSSYTSYKYTKMDSETISSGLVNNYPQFSRLNQQISRIHNYPSCLITLTNEIPLDQNIRLHSNSVLPLDLNTSSYVGYSCVKTEFGAGSQGGLLIQEFSNIDTDPDIKYGQGFDFDISPATSLFWNRGLLTSEKKYKVNGSSISLVDSTSYFYSKKHLIHDIKNSSVGIALDKNMMTLMALDNSINFHECMRDPWYCVGCHTYFRPYIITSGWYQLDSTVKINDNQIIQKEVFTYAYDMSDTLRLVKSKSIYQKNDIEYKTSYSYAADFINILDDEYGISKLREKKLYSNIVEVRQDILVKGQPTRFLNAKFNSYWENNSKLNVVYEINPDNTSVNFTPAFVNNKKINIDSGYSPKLFYDSYDHINNLTQLHQQNGHNVSILYGYQDRIQIAVVVNSALAEAGHTSFETNELNGWTKYEPNEFETIPANVFSGKFSMKINGGYGPYQIFTVGSKAEKHSGYKASVWVKGEGAYLHIEVNGEWSSHVKVKNEFTDGLWHKLEVELPRHKIQPYFSQGENLKLKAYIGTEKGTCYFDDIRFHPSDAQMTTYTHEPLIGVTSISDENNKPVFYIYDSFGRLEYIKDFEGNILKKNDYHYRTNGQ